MRVLHVLCSTAWGGAERIAATVCRLGRAHGLSCSVDGPALPEIVRGIEAESGDVLPAARKHETGWRWLYNARQRRLANQPDLVHVHLATPGLSSAGWYIAGGTPTVFTFHLLPQRECWSKDYFLPLQSERVLQLFERYQSPHRLVAVSQADQERLSLRFPCATVRLALNAPPLAPAHAPAVSALTYPATALRLLSVGRIQEQKGLDRLIQALSHPCVRELDWHWIVVGDGSQRRELEQLVERVGLAARITFVGARPAHTLFQQADLVICPSRFEGMPLVPLEAHQAGVPVLLSDIESHREAFGAVADCFLPEAEALWPEGLSRMLCSPKTVQHLRTQLSSLQGADPRERLWRDYDAIYREVLAGK